MKNKFTYILIFLSASALFYSCKITKESGYTDSEFKQYLIVNNIININTLMNDKLYDDYYSVYKYDKIKRKLESNPFLKVNQVYIYYSETKTITFGTFIEEGVQSVTFVIYSDEGRFGLSTFDLNKNSFTAPENGIIKLKKSVIVEDFGGFEITNDQIKTKKRNKTPYKEWYDHVNGYVKNDTIHFTNKYIGKEYKFEKKWNAIKRKINFNEVYQPNLKVVKYKSKSGLTCFEVTGEFSVK